MPRPDIARQPPATTLAIEADGVLIDVEPVYWTAYAAAANEIGRPKTDRGRFWRAIRTAAPTGTILNGAKTAQVRPFELRLSELVESDEAWSDAAIPDETGVLRKMRNRARLVLLSIGRNRPARQKCLDAAGLSDHFLEMHGLPADRDRRIERLSALSKDWGHVLVVASTDRMVRSSDAAGLFTVGVSSGPCGARLLERAGARCVFPDIAALASELAGGAPQLTSCGWHTPARLERTP